jgi:hypothetical protein
MADITYGGLDLTLLEGRVNQLDGAGLPAGQTSDIAALQKQINGLKTTMNNLTLTFEQQLQALTKQVANLTILVNTITGTNS